jgi:hypothetical protein
MKPRDFDFVRFSEWIAEREERMRAFLEGRSESNVVLLEKNIANYVVCRTPQESLSCQLDAITQQMDSGSDYMPFLEPWFGVGVYATAFGAKYTWIDGEAPQTHYIVHDENEAERLPVPDIDRSPEMKLVLDAIDYFVAETRGIIPVCCTDTQSPIDTATLIWETSSFFTAMFTAPEAVHRLLQKVTDVTIAFSRKQIARLGTTWARPGHIMLSARGVDGFSISDDNIVMLSPDQYEALAMPYNEQISSAFGGLAVHSCGNYERQLPALLKTKGLRIVDGAFSPVLDPTPNTQYELFRDGLRNTGVILQARVHFDWPQILPRLYDPDVRLALCVPGPAPDEPADKNMVLLDKMLAGRFQPAAR